MVSPIKPIMVSVGLISLVNSQVLVAANNDWIKGVAVDGLVEVQAGYTNDYYDKDSSSLVLGTASLGFTGQVNEWSTVRLAFLYKDSVPLRMDETHITLGNLNKFPVYVKAGRTYLPFGRYQTQFITDAITYSAASTMAEIGQLGFEAGGAYGLAYIYGGRTQDDTNDTLDHYGASLGFSQESDSMTIDVGVDYISDFGDVGTDADAASTWGILPVISTVGSWDNYEYVAGIVGRASFSFGPVFFNGEYMTALDAFKPEFLAFGSEGAEPKIWYAELGLNFKIAQRDFTFGAGYAASEEALAMDLPKERYTVGMSLGIVDNTTLYLEYRVDNDYEVSDGGTGEDAQAASLKVAVTF